MVKQKGLYTKNIHLQNQNQELMQIADNQIEVDQAYSQQSSGEEDQQDSKNLQTNIKGNSKVYKVHTSKVLNPKIKQNPKYYRVTNPNYHQEELKKVQSTCNTQQLTLTSLLVFLLLLSLFMYGFFKIIQQVYQIQHPQTLQHKQNQQKRINMDGNSIQSQNIIVQPSNNQKIDQSTNKVAGNKLQQIQKRYQNRYKNDNPINAPQNQGEKKVIVPSVLTVHQTAEDDMVSEQLKLAGFQQILEKREQIVEGYQSNQQMDKSTFEISLKHSSYDQKPDYKRENPRNQIVRTPSRVRIQTNRQSSPTGPIGKANITRQHAIQWKPYTSMTTLPLDSPFDGNAMLEQQYLYYENKYNISQYKQLPICVVIPSYNNVKDLRYQENLKSILQQNYTNYHVVLIDDKSEDNTGKQAIEYMKTFDQKYQDRVKVIINQERKMAMPNLRYAAMHECQENQLFIIVDGDDLLIGRQVFKLFSAVMQQKDYWIMWTNFLSPKGSIGYSREYSVAHKKTNNYRKAGFVMSHLRAYYTKLFRLVKEEDLKNEQGEYFHAANDVAISIPILQMAHQHAGYVPELTYFYNLNTGLNNHRVRLKEQKKNDKIIRKKSRYQALDKLQFGKAEDLVEKYEKNLKLSKLEPVQTPQKQNIDFKNLLNHEESNNQQRQKVARQDIDIKDQLHRQEAELSSGENIGHEFLKQQLRGQNNHVNIGFEESNTVQMQKLVQQIKQPSMLQQQLDLHKVNIQK